MSGAWQYVVYGLAVLGAWALAALLALVPLLIAGELRHRRYRRERARRRGFVPFAGGGCDP